MMSDICTRLDHEIRKAYIGDTHTLQALVVAFLCGGHVLLEGAPGLAKTTLAHALAQAVDAQFRRIQFTADLMPADITGSSLYRISDGDFKFIPGPVFTHILLADEINRAPAKVQSALLESMQEKQVTIGDETYRLPKPFLVLATQNPIEQEGTYPLPEAQVDRFMFKCLVETPTKADERRIMQRFAENAEKPEAKTICTPEDIAALRESLKQVYCDEKVGDYILEIVFKTREADAYIQNGASPRATLALNLAARGNALLHGRAYATPQDVKEVVHDVLRHRILLTYEAEAEGITADGLIDKILNEVPVP